MMKKLMVLMVSCIVTFSFQACDKETAEEMNTVATEPVNFKAIGYQHILSSITFKTEFKESKKLTWQFGDGESTVVNDIQVSHTYTQPGTYPVTLNVEDGKEGTGTIYLTITNDTKKLTVSRSWFLVLNRTKDGNPPTNLPHKLFEQVLKPTLANYNTIEIPNIDNMPAQGPYKVTLSKVIDDRLVFQNNDSTIWLSYNKKESEFELSITLKEGDITYKLGGRTDMFE